MNKHKLRLALVAVFLLAYFAWLIRNALSGDGVAILFLFGMPVVFAFTVSAGIKKNFLSAFQLHYLQNARAEEFPDLDTAQLAQLTRTWEELGFVFAGDTSAGTLGVGTGAAFSRSFEHPTEGAVAEITQQFAPLKTLPFTSSVMSCWGERAPVFEAARALERNFAPLASPSDSSTSGAPDVEESNLWVLITHNRPPNKFWPLLRRRRIASLRLPPGTAPEVLWPAHLERRAEVEARLQQPHLRGELAPLGEAHGQLIRAHLLQRMRRTPAWKFGAAFLSRAPVPARYDGELPA